jgi:hypothetical protein
MSQRRDGPPTRKALGSYELVTFINLDDVSPYVILSHPCIEGKEVTYDAFLPGWQDQGQGWLREETILWWNSLRRWYPLLLG